MRLRLAPWLLLLPALCGLASAQANQQPLGPGDPLGRSNRQWVTVAAPPAVTVAPGKVAVATLNFRVSEGNHINSSKPGSELLIPTRLNLKPPPEVRIARITYPAGHDLTFSFAPDEKLNVYTGDFEVKVAFTVGARVSPGTRLVQGELQYQACNDRACFPPKHLPIELGLKVLPPGRTAAQ